MEVPKTTIRILALVLAFMPSTQALAAASLEKCLQTLEKFRQLGDVPEMMAQSYGYAVLPTIGKGGIGIGGAGGTGCVFKGGRHTGNVSMGQITIGWQLGGQFGVDATAVALTYGASAGASTKGASASAGDTKAVGSWKRGMAVYTLATGGLMYEASIGGQKFAFKPLRD